MQIKVNVKKNYCSDVGLLSILFPCIEQPVSVNVSDAFVCSETPVDEFECTLRFTRVCGNNILYLPLVRLQVASELIRYEESVQNATANCCHYSVDHAS